MKICIPIKPQHEGGGFYFIGLFREYLTRTNTAWTEDIQDAFDTLFVNSWQVPYETISAVKQQHTAVRVIHRVDGSARDYGRYDNSDSRQARVNMLADATIFQSNYGRDSTRKKFPVIKHDGPVIYNPVDIEMFNPQGETVAFTGSIKVCNAAWSTNIKKGTWQIPSLARRHADVTFVLCGRYDEKVDLPNVEYSGHLSYERLAAVMRSCDAYLDPSENECCPNVVLQALASGLPVLHKNSGGVPELVGDAGIVMASDLSNFREALGLIITAKESLGTQARRRAVELFAPQVIFPRYLAVIESARRNPLPTRCDWLRVAMQGYPVMSSPLWRYPLQLINKLFRNAGYRNY